MAAVEVVGDGVRADRSYGDAFVGIPVGKREQS